jgi:hypothetical protein
MYRTMTSVVWVILSLLTTANTSPVALTPFGLTVQTGEAYMQTSMQELPQAGRVNVTLYVMSRCPDAVSRCSDVDGVCDERGMLSCLEAGLWTRTFLG